MPWSTAAPNDLWPWQETGYNILLSLPLRNDKDCQYISFFWNIHPEDKGL